VKRSVGNAPAMWTSVRAQRIARTIRPLRAWAVSG